MPELFSVVGKLIEYGFAAVAVIAVLVSFIWNQWKIVPALNALVRSSEALIKSVDALEDKMDKSSDLAISTSQKQTDMHETCKQHSEKFDAITSAVSRIEGGMAK